MSVYKEKQITALVVSKNYEKKQKQVIHQLLNILIFVEYINEVNYFDLS